MTRWVGTIAIKGLFKDREPNNATVAYVADTFTQGVERLPYGTLPPHLRNDRAFLDIVAQLNDLAGDALSADPEATDLVGELNSILDELYDWGDRNRVWIA